MKKRLSLIIKIICFAAIFCLLWQGAQFVLDRDWDNSGMLALKYKAFSEEKKTDVLMIGASNIYAGAAPAVIWHESGITSYNFGVSSTCMMLCYYQLKYLLQDTHPSLVILDMSGVSTDKDPTSGEMPFRKVYSSLPDEKIKAELLNDMCAHWEDTDPLLFRFPLLRYHERWEDLSEADFNEERRVKNYKPYSKGCYISIKQKKMDLPDDLFLYNRESALDVHMEYVQKIYELCESQGIELMLVSCPRIRVYYADYQAGKEFAESHGLNFMSFTTKEDLDRAGILPDEDFYDVKHLNILGEVKFSTYLADYLKTHYTFESNENDSELCADWDNTYAEYMKYYNKYCNNMKIVK